MRRQFGDHIGDGESSGVGVGENTSDEGAQATRALLRGPGFRRACGTDERSDAAPGFEDSGALEVGVDAGDRIGIDAEVDRELADGRQLIPRPQPARGNRGAKAPLELGVKRRAVARIDRDNAHGAHGGYTNVLVQ